MWIMRKNDAGPESYKVGFELPGEPFEPIFERETEFDAKLLVSFLNGGEPDPQGTHEILEDICAALESIARALESIKC